jgi:hypothetical protein
MKHWNELEQSIFFNKVFSNLINIGTINLFSLQIENDRPSLGIGFDIPQFPDKLPEKWKSKGYNMCRIGLECSGISDLLIKNIPTSEILNVEIEESQEYFQFSATSETSLIQFKARHIFLNGPNVYLCEQNSSDVFTKR